MSYRLPFKKNLQETKLAINAVIEAGKAVMEIYEQDFSVELKQDRSPLTQADIKSNEIIQRIISVSGYPILSEESVDDKERLNCEKIWIVDPLDGTSDFVSRTGEFTIMVALIEHNKPILGVVYCPTNKTLFVAQKNGGAYNLGNGQCLKLSISNVAELERCRAVVSRHHLSDHDRQFLMKIKIDKSTQLGSSLKVMDICSGKAELYFATTNNMKQWDTCASCCIIKEAGGEITDMLGSELKYNIDTLNHQNGILVTNGLIHNKIIDNYAKFLKEEINK